MKYVFHSSEVTKAQSKIFEAVREGKPGKYILKLIRAKDKRSLNQNSYYWGVVVKIIADHTGYTPEETHQELARMFLAYEKDGKIFTQSTAKLDTLEFENYLERSRKWAWSQFELTIPLPNEVTEEMFDELERLP